MKGVKTKQEAVAAIVHVGESLEDALIRVDRDRQEFARQERIRWADADEQLAASRNSTRVAEVAARKEQARADDLGRRLMMSERQWSLVVRKLQEEKRQGVEQRTEIFQAKQRVEQAEKERDAVLKQLNRTNVRVAELLQERDRMTEV